MRLEGASESIRGVFPAEYADVAVVVTELGSPTVMMFLLATLYWLVDRERTVLVIGYAVAGLSLLLAIKAVLGLPRPPEALFLIELDADEYGFPSGHAFAATVVYGGLLLAFDRTRSIPALAGVSALVTLVALSRVVLGVHYLGDVVAGTALGIVTLLAFDHFARSDPRRPFAVALVIAVPALVVTDFSSDVLLGFGGALGGLVAAGRVDTLPSIRGRLEAGVLFVVGCGYVVALEVVISLVPWGSVGVTSVAVTATTFVFVVLYAIQVAGILLVPEAVGRLGGPLGSADSAGQAARSERTVGDD